MRRITLLLVGMLALFSTTAQRKNFTYKFYGFVRGDLFYNSRANMAPIDGNFYLYPLDKSFDADGKDLNATPNGSFYTFTSRLGLDVTGPDIGKARSSAKIETDFGGFSGSNTMLRIRQAYVNLDWGKSAVLVGITWHPLFGAVMPDVLNLSTGAPFQPFNRSPQIRYQYKANSRVQLTASVLWQLQYLSSGPKGMSEDYIKNSCIPEMFVGADFTPADGWLMGLGAHMISLKPRTSTERYFALGIHADRRRILQNVDSRSSACQHIRRGLDHLLVQFIDDLFLLRHDFHSFQFIISLSGEHCPQINDSNRWFQSELFRDGRLAYRRNSNDVISRTYIQFLLKPTIGTRHRHLDSLVRCSFFSNLNSSVWFSILSQ